MDFYDKERSSKYLEGIFETASEGIFVVDAGGYVLRSNPAFDIILGYEKDELNGKLFTEIAHKDAKVKKVTSQIKLHHFQRSSKFPIEMELIDKGGNATPVRLRSILIKNDRGEVIEAIGMVEDLREDKGEEIVEQKIWETQENLQNVLANSGDAIMVADANGRITIANEVLLQILGYQEDEIEGKHLIELSPYEGSFTTITGEEVSITEEYLNYSVEKANELFEKGKVTNYELYFIRKDGKIVPVEATLSVLKDQKGERRGSIAICRDITERKKAEEALKKSEEKYHSLIEHANDAIISTNKEGIIINFNKKAEEMFGYAHDEILGESITLLSPPRDRERQRKLLEEFKITNKLYIIGKTMEGKGLRKDGQEFPFEGSSFVLEINGEHILTVVIRDISERKKADNERKRLLDELKNKNKELEQIVYIASHDLRSPLVNVQGFSGELEQALKQVHLILSRNDFPSNVNEELAPILEEDIPDALKYIFTSVSKMDSLLSGLLRLSRLGRAALNFKHLNMDKLIADIVKSYEFQIKEAGVMIQIDKLPLCLGDETQINQVFSNLLDNSLKYLDPNRAGTIKISGREENGQVVYYVEDNGIGIATEHQDKIYEIFHRLNSVATHGEGLGLTIARRILDRHAGKIWVESEEGKGSIFCISLPNN